MISSVDPGSLVAMTRRAPGVDRARDGTDSLKAGERIVIDDEHRDGSIEVLHRMISYIRAEALRLQVMDVVLLLEHAEEAVVAFAPVRHGRQADALEHREARRAEH